MSNDNLSENGVNEAGTDREGFAPGSCSVRAQADFGRRPMTVRKKWTKEVNKLVMKCFYKSYPSKKGYRSRMMNIWREIVGCKKEGSQNAY